MAIGIKDYIANFREVRIRKGKFAFDITALMIGDFLLVNSISAFQLEDDGKFWIVPMITSDNLIELIEMMEPSFLVQSLKEALKT